MDEFNKLSNDLFQEVVDIVDDDDQYWPSPALRKLAGTYKRGHDAESRKYPTFQSHSDRFIAKMKPFNEAVKKGTLTFDAIVQAIASADSFFRGVDIKEVKLSIMEECQQVARNEIAHRSKTMGKIHAILKLLRALLQSRHPVRSDFQVDTGSRVGPYTAFDLDKAIIEETMGNVSQERLDAVKARLDAVDDAAPAVGTLDFSDPANVRAYVNAVNTHLQDSYESFRGQLEHRDPGDTYPRASAFYGGFSGKRAVIELRMESSASKKVVRNMITFNALPALYFDRYVKEERPFIETVSALLEHGDGYTASLGVGGEYGNNFLQEWAAMAVASSDLFLIETAEDGKTKEIYVRAAFVDMAA